MKIILTILAQFLTIVCLSQTVMNIYKNDGTVVSIPLSQIDSITYQTQSGAGNDTTNVAANVFFDGWSYPTITLGNSQQWISENLKTSIFANGDSIPQTEWSYYNGDTTMQNPYGKLYTWNIINDPRGVCPTGYHVPTESDWDSLINFLGGSTVAGGQLKSLQLWQSPNTSATDTINFNAVPSGYRYTSGFYHLLLHAGFWTSTEGDQSTAISKDLHFDSGQITTGLNQKTDGLAIRCLKD